MSGTITVLIVRFSDVCLHLHDDVIKWRHFPRHCPLWGEPPVTGGFPSQKPVTRSFGVFFDLRPNKRLRKQSGRRWYETPSRALWRYCNMAISSRNGILKWKFSSVRFFHPLFLWSHWTHIWRYIGTIKLTDNAFRVVFMWKSYTSRVNFK